MRTTCSLGHIIPSSGRNFNEGPILKWIVRIASSWSGALRLLGCGRVARHTDGAAPISVDKATSRASAQVQVALSRRSGPKSVMPRRNSETAPRSSREGWRLLRRKHQQAGNVLVHTNHFGTPHPKFTVAQWLLCGWVVSEAPVGVQSSENPAAA